MGTTTDDLDTPVTKTSTGVVILPRTHHAIERKLKPGKQQAAIGKSACDQCRYCTEFCPRFLLGYAVEPHQVMRTLAFTGTGADYFNQWAAMCCSCGLCTLYACPEELFPKEACDDAKSVMRAKQIKWTGPMNPKAARDGAMAAACRSRRSPKNCTCSTTICPRRSASGNFAEPTRFAAQAKRRHAVHCKSQSRRPRVSAGQIIGEPRAERAGRRFLHAPMARHASRDGRRPTNQNHFARTIILWLKNLLD